ncbi:MAG: extracellular solute-binding protein [Lachnospiraceae bacterium]
MKKKILSALLCLTVTAGMLAGCGNSTAAESGETPVTEAPETAEDAATEDAADGEKATLKMMVFPSTENYEAINEKFLEANPDIAEKADIEVILGGSGDGDVAQKLRLALTSGEDIPDIVRINYTQLPEFAEAGTLMDLTDYVSAYEDDMIDAAKSIMQYKGTYYALPREVKPKVWFYRADIFEECGINIADIKTLDDYIAAGGTIREKYPEACMENYNVPSKNYDFMMMLGATDGRFCDEEGNYTIASDEGVKLTFERMKKLYDSDVNSSVAEWSADWAPAFADGELVSQLIGGWFKTDFKNFALEGMEGKWAMAPWPEEIREGTDAGGAIWIIPKEAENAELAAEIMTKMCFDEDAAKIIYDITGVIPALKSASEDDYYNGDSYYASKLGEINGEAMQYASVYSYNPASSQEVTIVLQYLDEYLQGNMTVEEALQTAQDDLINQIGNPYNQ